MLRTEDIRNWSNQFLRYWNLEHWNSRCLFYTVPRFLIMYHPEMGENRVTAHLSILGCQAAQYKISSDWNVNQPSCSNVYLLLGSASSFAIGAVPAKFCQSKPNTSILGMPILFTSPLSQRSIKSPTSSSHMLTNYLNYPAINSSTTFNAFLKARNCWRPKLRSLYFRDEEPYNSGVASSRQPAKFSDIQND